jgi:hypothetical protein
MEPERMVGDGTEAVLLREDGALVMNVSCAEPGDESRNLRPADTSLQRFDAMELIS